LPAHTSYSTDVPENQTIFLILNIFPYTNSHRKAICRQEQRSKTATTAQISKSLPFQVKKDPPSAVGVAEVLFFQQQKKVKAQVLNERVEKRQP
jgi:hypothetical protein